MGRPKKKLPRIEVRTVENGYSLAIEGHNQEYLYFSPEKLMEGFMVHVGLKMTEQMSAATIKTFINSAVMFHNMKASHKELQKAKRETERITKMYRSTVKRLIDERHRVLRLCQLAKNCVTGHHSLTDALAALHARVHKDGVLKELSVEDFGITFDGRLPEDEDEL